MAIPGWSSGPRPPGPKFGTLLDEAMAAVKKDSADKDGSNPRAYKLSGKDEARLSLKTRGPLYRKQLKDMTTADFLSLGLTAFGAEGVEAIRETRRRRTVIAHVGCFTFLFSN